MELIPVGESVLILKLKVNTELNNTYGSIIKWIPNKNRYIIHCQKDNKKRLIKDENVGWIKIRNQNVELIKNTTTFFINQLSKNCMELQKLLEIFIFPPTTKYNSNEYFILEIQERDKLNFISITVSNNFIDKVMSIIKKLSFKINLGKPNIKILNNNPVKQLETRSIYTYTLKSGNINLDNYKPMIINKKDINDYLNLVGFKNIKDWIEYYWPDRKISNQKSYYGILKFFNEDGILPDYFFL